MADDALPGAPQTYDECVEHHTNFHQRFSTLPIEECERVICKIFVKRKREEESDAERD
jgi:hypothetical protein